MNTDNLDPGAEIVDPATVDVAGMLPTNSSDEWRERAACAQADPETFFSERDRAEAAAKKLCGSCKVINECLTHALDNGERFGVWGGLSAKERQRLRPGAAGKEAVDRHHRNRTVIELRKHGRNAPSIARATGLNERTVYRILNRAGDLQRSA